jgi:transposase-like protein
VSKREPKAGRRSWARTEKKARIAHAYVESGKLTPTEACRKARIHHHTYHRWLMTRDSEHLIAAVLKSDMRPSIKGEIARRLER